MNLKTLIVGILFFTLAFGAVIMEGCSPEENTKSNAYQQFIQDSVFDLHTYSNTKMIKTKHLSLDLDVNFEKKIIYGVARHEMINYGTDTAIFDIRDLDIQKITLGKTKEKETDFVIGPWDKDSLLGQPLIVKITPKTKYINIYYKTSPNSAAIDWLDPELTEGKKHPFLYTQGQAILTRSWIPVQGTPKNRITYQANVKVPKDLMAIMSAKNDTKIHEDGIYHFKMTKPIPCYLIALAVGNLSYASLGNHTGVYAEPELIDACAKEFKDLPEILNAAERIYGKYQWDQYDMVILPYSFPFGGMENPMLTFANPTLIAGDGSLISVIAHELAHSWSGNLVTNATWNDFWLNEGFTVYFENRIMEELYGKETADMLALIEFQELEQEINTIQKGKHPEDTRLKLALNGRDPDDGMTDIAYVKGAMFLKTLERDLGRQRLDKFLKNYFKQFAFKTITSEVFVDYLHDHLLLPNNFSFNTHEWIYEEGLPKNCFHIESPRFDQIKTLAKDFNQGKNIFKKKIGKKLERKTYITQEWMAFLRYLPDSISKERMLLLDKHLDFTHWKNAEIQTEWFLKGIRSGYQPITKSLEQFLTKVGRRKYILPLYEALIKTPKGKTWAKKVFSKAKGHYHYVSRKSVEDLLQ